MSSFKVLAVTWENMSVNLTTAASTTNATMTACVKKVSEKSHAGSHWAAGTSMMLFPLFNSTMLHFSDSKKTFGGCSWLQWQEHNTTIYLFVYFLSFWFIHLLYFEMFDWCWRADHLLKLKSATNCKVKSVLDLTLTLRNYAFLEETLWGRVVPHSVLYSLCYAVYVFQKVLSEERPRLKKDSHSLMSPHCRDVIE